jgi:hypothetical protein
MDSNLKQAISRKQRQENMNDILETLNPDKHNFNTLILGFTDIMQGSFYNFLSSQCRSQTERKALNSRINECVNAVMEVLNEHSLSNPEDMVVLNTVMIEAINKALIRQGSSKEGPTVSHTIKPSR